MSEQLVKGAADKMDQAVSHLEQSFKKIMVGRASSALVEDLPVSAYGSMTTIKGLASVSTPDASTIVISPWDQGLISEVEKAIADSDLGINPQNDGSAVRLNIPKPTEEKRVEVVKAMKEDAENTRISIRNIRQDVHASLKELEKSSDITEDDLHMYDKKLQQEVDRVNKHVDEMVKSKEEDLMTI